jgi:hypothetical protein
MTTQSDENQKQPVGSHRVVESPKSKRKFTAEYMGGDRWRIHAKKATVAKK